MYCSKTFFKNASRMKTHLGKVCKNCPKQIKRKFMQHDEENASSSDNDNQCVLINESTLSDNLSVIDSDAERSVPEIPPQPATSTSSFAATCSTICSSSIDVDLEMPPPSASIVVNKTITPGPATTLMKPTTSRNVFEFADRMSKKEQVSVVD